MENQTCKDCAHFYQHYVMTEDSCVRAYCGHCCYGRQKRKRPDSKICEGFLPQPKTVPDRQRTIHYLTTTVLERILDLELPPEIKDV